MSAMETGLWDWRDPEWTSASTPIKGYSVEATDGLAAESIVAGAPTTGRVRERPRSCQTASRPQTRGYH